MKRAVYGIVIAALLCPAVSYAQSLRVEEVLGSVEKNNITLKALAAELEAEKLENSLSSSLPDPEIEFSYLWGSPVAIGNRQDVSASQTFDYATLSGARRRAADGRNDLAESSFRSERQSILLQAEQCCIDLVYYNALIAQVQTRVQNASDIAASLERKLSLGQANQLEYNNAVLSLSKLSGSLTALTVERDAVMLELRQLNGGEPLCFDASEYESVMLPSDFEQWASEASDRSPALAYVRAQVKVGEEELALRRSEAMPSLSVGYAGEFVVGQRYQGVSVGVSVPLWSAGRRVKQAQASLSAARARHSDAKSQFYHNLEIQYQRTAGLQKVAQTYVESLLKVSDNVALLQKAMDRGAVSVLDYMLQMEFFYDTLEQTLTAQRDFQKSYAALTAFEL